ncbi:hypothetical protein V6Z11_A03G132300 [Gossypium hirsutum]
MVPNSFSSLSTNYEQGRKKKKKPSFAQSYAVSYQASSFAIDLCLLRRRCSIHRCSIHSDFNKLGQFF